MKNRKIKISILTCERTVVTFRQESLTTYCEICGCDRKFIKPESAEQEFDLTMREIFQLVENGALHILETPDGQTFVCRFSLENYQPRE